MNEDKYFYRKMNLPMITEIEKENPDNIERIILDEIEDFCQYYTDVCMGIFMRTYIVGFMEGLTDGNIVDFFIYMWFEKAYYLWKTKASYEDHDMTINIFGILQRKVKLFKEPEDEKEADYQKMFKYILKFLNDHM